MEELNYLVKKRSKLKLLLFSCRLSLPVLIASGYMFYFRPGSEDIMVLYSWIIIFSLVLSLVHFLLGGDKGIKRDINKVNSKIEEKLKRSLCL